MVNAFAHFCEKALGRLLQQESILSSASSSSSSVAAAPSSPLLPLEPFLSIVFTVPLPASSDPTYLAKRLLLAAGCIKKLHAYTPASCEPFVQAASLLCSHSSDIVRSAVAELLSALPSCCKFDGFCPSTSLSPRVGALISWVDSFFSSFIPSLLRSICNADAPSTSVASSDLLLKSTLSSCSFAHPSIIRFAPEIVSMLLLMFEDTQSASSSNLSSSSSVVTPPGRLLCALAELPIPSATLTAVSTSVCASSRHTSRHVRIACAGFSCLLSSNMMITLSQHQHLALLAIPQGLLNDSHPDVRAAAQTALLRMLRAPQLLPCIPQVRV